MDRPKVDRPNGWKDQEPFATIRRHPYRFGIGIPAVFIGGMAAGLLFVERSLPLAIAVQLVLQTGGFAWLYVPVAMRRWRELGKPAEGKREREQG